MRKMQISQVQSKLIPKPVLVFASQSTARVAIDPDQLAGEVWVAVLDALGVPAVDDATHVWQTNGILLPNFMIIRVTWRQFVRQSLTSVEAASEFLFRDLYLIRHNSLEH